MNTPEASFLSWQQQFNTEQDFLEHLKQLIWPNGFVCSRCAHNKGTQLHCRQLTECDRCHKQASIISGTLFHSSNLPLLKWFLALYFIGSDKGSISALRLIKVIEVNWRTARLILKKVTVAMGHRDSLYRLSGTIELDDAFVGRKHKSKRGR
jgi:hypothetical protein